MLQEDFNYRSYKYDEVKAENLIFQAYLYAFFRHTSYIYRLYNTGKICELQAIERISAASEKLKLINNKLKSQAKIHNDDTQKQVFIVKPINFVLNSDNQSAFWN